MEDTILNALFSGWVRILFCRSSDGMKMALKMALGRFTILKL